jgi:hypothetical protein
VRASPARAGEKKARYESGLEVYFLEENRGDRCNDAPLKAFTLIFVGYGHYQIAE